MIKQRYYKYLISLLLALLSFIKLHAQIFDYKSLDTISELSLEQALKIDPLKVYRLNLRKTKLVDLPVEIGKFKNLQTLNVSKNKFHHVPAVIFSFQYLQKLDLSANKIQQIPPELGKLIYLKEFIANQTNISAIPPEINKLINLIYLDVWGTNISSFPTEIRELNGTIKEIDMRVIMMNENEHQNIKEMLPNTKIYFSKACNCGF